MAKKSSLAEKLGFREEAPESLKKAYINHLEQNANGVVPYRHKTRGRKAPRRSLHKSLRNETGKSQQPEQLEFDFMNEAPKPKAKIS